MFIKPILKKWIQKWNFSCFYIFSTDTFARPEEVDYYQKLLVYQNLIGISNDEVERILHARRNPEIPRFRYQRKKALEYSTSHLHVNFETKTFDVNTVYNSGIFFCQIPGTYLFSATTQSWDSKSMDLIIKQNDVWQGKSLILIRKLLWYF